MKASGRNWQITLQRATTAQDDTGQEIETWSTLATPYASWRRASARETLAAAEVSAAVTDIFETLWSSAYGDLTSRDRLTFNGRTYDIIGTYMIGYREGLGITAAARAD
jgi:SPP1 family predicted phage head-tail adaptor